MFLRGNGRLRIAVLAGLGLFLLGGCTRAVKQEGRPVLPPVERVAEEPVEEVEEAFEEPIPAEIEIADLDAKVEKKTYPGIEGEFIETTVLKDCYFEFDKHDLTLEARKVLAENCFTEWVVGIIH